MIGTSTMAIAHNALARPDTYGFLNRSMSANAHSRSSRITISNVQNVLQNESMENGSSVVKFARDCRPVLNPSGIVPIGMLGR